MNAREEAIVTVLRRHRSKHGGARGVEACACGESKMGEPGWFDQHLAAHLDEAAQRADGAEPITAVVLTPDPAVLRLGDTATVTGTIGALSLLFPDGHVRVTLDVAPPPGTVGTS